MRLRRVLLFPLVLLLPLLGVATPASAAAVHSGTQHFLALSSNPAANSNTLIGTGPIHARGKDTQTGANTDVFAFPAGKLKITHKAKGITKDHFDPATCLDTTVETGTYTITGGTGAYAKAKGHGTYALSVLAVGCSTTQLPDPFQLTIRAVGPISF
jgi:hypothetical protein